jgi:DNA polymerase-3 subunit alpha
VDPLEWGTSFDRFLQLERMKPPDIDIDVDYRGRQRLIDHLRAVFPSMVQVGTYAQIGITNQQADDGSGEDTGSVFVQYMAAQRKRDPNFDGHVRKEHRAALNDLADTPVYKSMGTNAAGFILPGDSLPINEYLPLGRIISSNTLLTQYNKDDVEALGYMKMDVLGLRALQTLNGTLTRIGRQPNDWDWIPYDDKDACKLLRSGHCVGLFQYEGFSSQQGGREMGIKSTHDTILGLALYRPALMNGGQKDQYLANRGRKRDDQVRMPAYFDPVVKDTLGVILFQDQVLEALQLLKMQFRDYNDLMTAVKASNGFIANAAETFKRIQPIFYDLCDEAGLEWYEQDEAWAAIVGFTEYGFNRAHATSYGLMSYRSAYLKAHFPLEYMASLLDVWAGEKKEPLYVKEARDLGFSIVKADVNFSGASWDIDPTRANCLRKGMVSLKDIGWSVAEAIVNEREANGPFADMDDFVTRCPARPVTGGKEWKKHGTLKGVCETLRAAGALRSLGL